MSAKVLVVDDQEMICEVLTECLEIGGYDPYVASSGEEGLRQIEKHQPDLVITDMRMPGMDGFEFSSRVREVSDAPIIMLTGMGEIQQEDGRLELVDVFLSKPIEINEFLAQVEAALRGKDTQAASTIRAAD